MMEGHGAGNHAHYQDDGSSRPRALQRKQWSVRLCVISDWVLCCCTCFCPCFGFGMLLDKVAPIEVGGTVLNKESKCKLTLTTLCFLMFFPIANCVILALIGMAVAARFNIDESVAMVIYKSCCCAPCYANQIAAEPKANARVGVPVAVSNSQ